MLENRLHRRHPLVQTIMDNWIYVVMIIVMWQLPGWLSDHFGNPIRDLGPRDVRGNQALSWMAVAIELYILAILAMSYNLAFGFAGILSFGHALFWGIGVYIVIIFIIQFSQSLITSVGMALAIAALVGLFTALAAFRIRGVYFAMFTLALAQIFFELSRVNMFRYLTNGDDGLRFTGDQTPAISLSVNRLDLYYLSAVIAAVTFFFIRRLMNSPTGKIIIALRDNEERTQTMGYNIYRYKTLVIVLSGMLGTVAGILNAFSTKGAEPSALGLVRTVDPLLMTIIGGMGTNPGPVIGAAVLHLGETFLSKPDLHINLNFILFRYDTIVNTKTDWALALGVVFIIIVMVIPYGIVGEANRRWIEMRRWLRRFGYDPVLRRYPQLAERMTPFTGEPAGVALMLARQSAGDSVFAWAIAYPIAAIYSTILILAGLAALLSWNIHNGIALLLFLWLITLPATVGYWIRSHRAMLRDQMRTLLRQMG